jgi:hypothetical protein
MRTGYLRLRMGSMLSERAATRAVRWEPCGLRCSASAECGEAGKLVTMVAMKRTRAQCDKETGRCVFWASWIVEGICDASGDDETQ